MRTPASIGRYRVVSLIGVGASATVFRAVRPDDDFQVAIKVLADNHSAVAESRRRFADEQRLMAALDHASIATVYDTGETEDGRPFTVMELANRGDLRSRVKTLSDDGIQPTAADVQVVGAHLRDALTVLRTNDVVHRDISPSNIFIRADITSGTRVRLERRSLLAPGERLVLGDLGFAKRLTDASGLTRGGGTEGFAAPEQQSSVSIVDHKADLYSATALIKWLATGTPLAGHLANFVAVGTADEPDDRHHDVDHWFRDLSGQLRSAPAGAGPPNSAPLPERRGWGLAAMVAAVAAAAVLGLLALWQWQRQPGEPVADNNSPREAVEELADDDRSAISVVGSTTASTSTSVATTSTAEPTAETTAEPTTPESAESTTESTTTELEAEREAEQSSTSNPFPFSPRAYFDQPADGAAISDNLTISGTAVSPTGVDHVELVVRHVEMVRYWHDDPGEMRDEFIRFPVPVTPDDGTDTTWTYQVPLADIPAGTYRLRVWARSVDGTGDPLGETRTVTVG